MLHKAIKHGSRTDPNGNGPNEFRTCEGCGLEASSAEEREAPQPENGLGRLSYIYVKICVCVCVCVCVCIYIYNALAGVSEVSEDKSSRTPAREGFNSALCSSPSTTNAASNFQGSTVDDSSATSSLFERCFQLMCALLVFVYLRSFVDFQSLLYLFAS